MLIKYKENLPLDLITVPLHILADTWLTSKINPKQLILLGQYCHGAFSTILGKKIENSF